MGYYDRPNDEGITWMTLKDDEEKELLFKTMNKKYPDIDIKYTDCGNGRINIQFPKHHRILVHEMEAVRSVIYRLRTKKKKARELEEWCYVI